MDIDLSSLIGIGDENKVFDGFEMGEYDVPLVDGIRNGKGTQTLKKNGEEYTLECTWENGKKNGEGILLDPNTIMAMKLNFKDDLVNGEGSLFENGQLTFRGNWTNGERCGKGEEFSGGKLVFSGNYEHDKRNGYGILYDDEHEPIFEGIWVDGEKGLVSIEEDEKGDRKMIERDSEGHIRYIGGFLKDTVVRDGQGVTYDESENPLKICKYREGTEERVLKEFKGKTIVIYDAQGKKCYEGEYKQDSRHTYPPHGQGRQFVNGSLVYMGAFVNGHRQGQGKSFYPNHTAQYIGDWMNDMANGQGQYMNEEGELVAEGEFVDNVYTGEEIRVYIDTGRIEKIGSGSGCACFGQKRRAATRQLPSSQDADGDGDGDGEETDQVRSLKELRALPASTMAIRIAGFEEDAIDFVRFNRLRHLTIAEGALRAVKQLALRELRSLRSLEIERNACCSAENAAAIDKKEFAVEGARKALEIEACERLESVVLHAGACCDFAKLTLAELPQLRSVRIGESSAETERPSNCFYWCKEVRFQDLEALTTLVIGNSCFEKVQSVYIKNLPKLSEIELGFRACAGLQDIFERGSNLLEMRELPALQKIVMHPNALLNVGEIKVVGIPQLNGAGIAIAEGCRGGLKTLKRGENVDDSVVDVLKGETGAKVSKLKKKGSSMCSVFSKLALLKLPRFT